MSRTSTSSTSTTRNVILPLEDSECCCSALRWAIANVARPGDVFHLAHVLPRKSSLPSSPSSSLSSSPRLRLSPPSPRPNSFCADDPLAAQAELHSSRAMIKRRFSPLLEQAGITHEVHLLEPAEAGDGGGNRSESVGEAIRNLASSLPAALIVISGLKGSAASKRGGTSCGTSVTKYCLDRSPATVCVVRGGR